MSIEQELPERSSFPKVVAIFCFTLLAFFVLAYIFLDFTGKHVTFRHHGAHPTSQIVNPSPRTTDLV